MRTPRVDYLVNVKDAGHIPALRLHDVGRQNVRTAKLETLESRRDQLTERFFQHSVLPQMACLHSPPSASGQARSHCRR